MLNVALFPSPLDQLAQNHQFISEPNYITIYQNIELDSCILFMMDGVNKSQLITVVSQGFEPCIHADTWVHAVMHN